MFKYSKTVLIAQTFKLITFLKITKAPLYNNILTDTTWALLYTRYY